MKLKRSKLQLASLCKNKPLLVGLAVIGASIVFALVALGLRLYYQQQMASWTQKIDTLAHTYTEKFKADSGNSEALGQTLSALQSELKATQPPAKPQLLFVTLESSDEAQRRETATEQTTNLIATTGVIQEALTYQAAVSAELQKLSGQSAQDAAQLKTLAATWEQAITAIQAIQTPQQLHDFQTKLIAHLQACHNELSALPPLFESQDRAGFLAKQDSLNQNINALQGLTTDLANHLKTLDNDLNGPLTSLIAAP